MFNKKIVSAPLLITDMDSDLESKTIYVFNYNSSSFKGEEFLNYISNSGITSDVLILDTPYTERENLLLYYMKSPNYYTLYSFNSTILKIICKIKGIDTNVKSFLNDDEIDTFILNNKNIILSWINFYESLFYLMLEMIKFKNKTIDMNKIKSTYSNINNTDELSPNICGLLLFNEFWDFYKNGVNENNKVFYTYYFENDLYDEKTISNFIISDNNYIWKILYDTFYDKRFHRFINKWLKQS